MNDTALLVIDFINDIIHPNGKLGMCADYVRDFHVIENLNQALSFARRKAIPIFFIIVGFSHDYREILPHSPLFGMIREKEALQLNTWGCQIHEQIDYRQEDTMVIKNSISPFYGTNLDLILRRSGIKKIITTGVSTDMAIQSTIREGHDRGYEMYLCEKACGARTKEGHLESVQMLKRLAKIYSPNE